MVGPAQPAARLFAAAALAMARIEARKKTRGMLTPI